MPLQFCFPDGACDLGPLMNGQTGFELQGEFANDASGYSVSRRWVNHISVMDFGFNLEAIADQTVIKYRTTPSSADIESKDGGDRALTQPLLSHRGENPSHNTAIPLSESQLHMIN